MGLVLASLADAGFLAAAVAFKNTMSVVPSQVGTLNQVPTFFVEPFFAVEDFLEDALAGFLEAATFGVEAVIFFA